MNSAIVDTYSQVGGELPYFVGKQYGTGWFSTITKYAFPILRRLFHVASNTAQDVINKDKPILSSLKEHAINEAKDTLKRGLGKKRQRLSINRARKRRQSSSNVPPFFIKKKRRRR